MTMRSKLIICSLLATLILSMFVFWYSDTKYGHLDRGKSLVDRGKYEMAIYHFDKVIEIDRRNAEAYCNRGIAYREIGKSDLAMADFNQAIEIRPGYVDAYFHRGITRAMNGDLDAAITDFSKAIELNPRDYEAFRNRALALRKRGNRDKYRALSDFSKAIEINPTYSDAYFSRAELWRELGKYEEAISDYDMAIETDKNNSKAYTNKAHLLATCSNNKYRNGKEAVRLAAKAVGLKKSAITLSVLAHAYAEDGQFEEAIKLQLEAIALLEKESDPKKIADFKQELESYQNHKPWRE